MITRQSWTTLVLGALAGAGLGAGALTLVKRSSGGCCGAATPTPPSEPAPGAAVPGGRAVADGGSTAALTTLAKDGPADGRWTYQDARRSADNVLTRDVSHPDVFHLRGVSEPASHTKALPLDVMARVLFGNVPRFLQNYRPCEGAASETTDGRDYLRVRWCNLRGDSGPVRDVWMDAITHELARIEDRTSDGHLIRGLRFAVMPAADIVPPVPGAAARAKASLPALSSRTVPSFADFVAKVELPIYEPAELPPGYARTAFGFENRKREEAGVELKVVWIGYDEGVMQMSLFIAPPEDMGRLEALSRMASVKGPSPSGAPANTPTSPVAGCSSMPVDTPEETVEGEGAVTVRIRSDGCRIVVRRDDLPGVSIALVGSAATPRDSYIRVIRNLVLVSDREAVAPKK